jgi:hypothetical protein
MDPLLSSGWEFGQWHDGVARPGQPANIGGVGDIVQLWETRQARLLSTFPTTAVDTFLEG